MVKAIFVLRLHVVLSHLLKAKTRYVVEKQYFSVNDL